MPVCLPFVDTSFAFDDHKRLIESAHVDITKLPGAYLGGPFAPAPPPLEVKKLY